ncbi:FAD-dependent oxidoreductase [Streptomyces sp. NPDC056161]|uniref:FAD-dependent oxidoreductase n=1 Tax=Streptomyces sp. NPDC056161 TaxID=3345732 RepID=UPI0035D563B8
MTGGPASSGTLDARGGSGPVFATARDTSDGGTPHSDVVIVGAGVGGSFLALLLGQRGLRVTVVERAERIAAHGADFLKPRGLRLLSEQGLLPELLSRGALRRDTISYYHDGDLLQDYSYLDHTGLGYFLILPYREIVTPIVERAQRLLNVEFAFGTTVAAVETRPLVGRDGEFGGEEFAGVEAVVLSDGRRLSTRAVVDAGGPTSPVRAFVGARQESYGYEHEVRMVTIPVTPSIAERNRMYFDSTGWFAYFYPVDAEQARVFVGVPRHEDAAVFEERTEKLTERLRGFVTDSADALDALDPSAFLRAPVKALRTAHYHRGNVALLGGTAFSCHPMTGQGMSYTLEDASLLADLIARSAADGGPELESLLAEEYESRREVHARLVDYGDDLAGSYPNRELYQKSFRPGMHGGDV